MTSSTSSTSSTAITPDQWNVALGVLCSVRRVMSARGDSHVLYFKTERDELSVMVERYVRIYLSGMPESPEKAAMSEKYRSLCFEWILSDLHQMSGDHALSFMWREPVYHLMMGFNA